MKRKKKKQKRKEPGELLSLVEAPVTLGAIHNPPTPPHPPPPPRIPNPVFIQARLQRGYKSEPSRYHRGIPCFIGKKTPVSSVCYPQRRTVLAGSCWFVLSNLSISACFGHGGPGETQSITLIHRAPCAAEEHCSERWNIRSGPRGTRNRELQGSEVIQHLVVFLQL